MARTFSYGGGVGIDLSNLRPKGAVIHNAAKEATGPVSFMDLFSQVTQTISQNGRRGATMISL
jgi:ribonucleoside-diphosphate reductase alpha chain